MQRNTRLALAIAALTLTASQTFAAENIDDAAITGKVKAALVADPAAKAYQIDVDTKDGIVQLNGFVDSSAGKTAAARVAGSVSGVKGIDNNLDVQTSSRSPGEVIDDAAVTAKVKAALVEDPVTKAMQIDVDTREGTVQLTGNVSSESEKDRATEVARGIDGVRSIENNLTVKP